MSRPWTLSSVVVALFVGLWSAKAVQEDGPPLAQSGPEHEILKTEVGDWDALVKMMGPPGAPPEESKGGESISLIHGGLWILAQYNGEFMGQEFTGTGITGYDTKKQKYVTVWVDSMTDSLTTLEGTYDAKSNAFTFTYEGPSMMAPGETVTHKHTTVLKDNDTRVFTMAEVGSDGKDAVAMEITYKRKK